MEFKVSGQLVDDKEKPLHGIHVVAILEDDSLFSDNHSLGETITDHDGEFIINLGLMPDLKNIKNNKIKIDFLIDKKSVLNISKDIKEEIIDFGIIKFDNGNIGVEGRVKDEKDCQLKD